MIHINSLIAFAFLFISCKAQTANEKIQTTASEVVAAIQKDDTATFISFIGYDNLSHLGKDREIVGRDVKKIKGFIDQYSEDKMPVIEITELYNQLGQKLVKVMISSGTKANQETKEMHLVLLFGPPNFVSLDKISGYQLIFDRADSLDFHPLSYWGK